MSDVGDGTRVEGRVVFFLGLSEDRTGELLRVAVPLPETTAKHFTPEDEGCGGCAVCDVAGLREAEGVIRAELREAVGKARECGATWAQIGTALGMARQSAAERFQR